MINLHTNISSLIAQSGLNSATLNLNQAVERMSTGYKINHAKDNAANYSISTNMTTKMSAYQVAEDNTAMGLDMVNTATESLSLIEDKLSRLWALVVQANNGTYGAQSKNAINTEANALIDEIERVYKTTEFNNNTVFRDIESSKFMQDIVRRDTSEMTTLESVDINTALTTGTYSISTPEELAKLATMTNNGLIGKNSEFVLANDIDLSQYDNWTPIGYLQRNNEGKFDVGNSNFFYANFDGNGYIISNLKTDGNGYDTAGLFGGIYATSQGFKISNLGIVNASITGNKNSAGALAGYMTSDSLDYSIENVFVENANVEGESFVGGLAGGASYGNIKDCYVKDVKITDNATENRYIGGFVGYSYHGNFTNCISESILEYYTDTSLHLGSFIGYLEEGDSNNPKGSVNNCIGIADRYRNGNKISTILTLGIIKNSPIIDSYSYTRDAVDINDFLPSGNQIVNSQEDFNKQKVKIFVGVNSDSESIELNFDISIRGLSSLKNFINKPFEEVINIIDKFKSTIESKQTELGVASNRLESAFDEIAIQYDNHASSRSTLRDADMAELSSTYIQQQILQQAAATLFSTANQTPSIALQLL